MFKLLLYLFSFCVTLFYVSCNKQKLKSPQASFLVVADPQLITSSNQGANSHKITDMWLYVNDNFQGIFPIGGVMPVVATGNAEIVLYAGIKNNGIAATRLPYTFYQQVKFNQPVEAGQTYTYTPVFEYLSNANFRYVEGFEGTTPGLSFIGVGNTTYSLVTDPNKVYGGTGHSLFMTMDNANPIGEIQSASSITGLPAGGASVYLELNYKNNQPFQVGIIGGGTDQRQIITINPSDDWNKIYVQLTTGISTSPSYTNYKLYIKATKTVSDPEIYLDNFKVISF
jgi:hypothetical protein